MTTTKVPAGTGASARALSRAPLTLVPRREDEAPLAIAAVFAQAAVARALIEALRTLDDVTLRQLRGVVVGSVGSPSSSGTIVVVTGPAELLPWRDGVRYLGQIVPGLYVPTTRTTSLPASLAAEAFARHLPAALIDGNAGNESQGRGSAGVPPASETLRLVPLRAGLPLSRAALAHLDDKRDGRGGAP